MSENTQNTLEPMDSEVSQDIQDTPPVLSRPFPVESIPEPGRSFIKAVAESVNVDLSFPAAAFLAICAGLIRARLQVKLKDGWVEPCILWVAVVGRSGSGKTPVLKSLMKPLKSIEEELRARGEQIIVSDATTEVLCQRLKENPQGLLLYRDELAGWIGSFNQYRNGIGADETHFLDMWSGTSIRVDRKKDNLSLFLEKTYLSVVGGIQPSILLSKFKGKHTSNGLAQRFLYAFPERRVRRWTDSGISNGMFESIETLYKELTGLDCQPKLEMQVLNLHSDALALFKDFCNDNATENNQSEGYVGDALEKMPAYLARIALVIHELKNVTLRQNEEGLYGVISAETMEESVRIINWFKREAVRVFSHFKLIELAGTGGLQHPIFDEISKWLKIRIKDDPVLSETLKTEAEEKGFTWSYVQKIANSIGVIKKQSSGHGGKSLWKQ